MLEVKNLLKVYKTKGGAEVRAVDDVSVAFNEKGMVFLLGKSGSGKSTLLNLCGGLDSPDGGEIVVKGRSSKDFTQADFDSYRNTFVGFVFQEYNILDEFSVEDNIALALELQGKNKDKAAVAEILSKVDLTDFAKRKPNTLSGGQKQRVAIARALVKNPEIILADEPTGALDSNTGKQVLDTLKKLSEEKLVIVVSHDREFAEQYGDRIIELKDGKIISDVTKTKIAAATASENVSFIGDDTVSVKDGSALTDEDMKKIRSFLSAKSGNVVIASGEKEVSAYKKVARIDDDGAKESFRDTEKSDVPEKKYGADDSKLIRSRLPVRHAVRIGASGLKVKPFRLFFTILLSFIAFAMFGLFSTLTFYDAKTTAIETYKNSDYDYLFTNKLYKYEMVNYSYGKETGRYSSTRNTRFSQPDLAAAKEKYGTVYGAYNFSKEDYASNNAITINNIKPLRSNYYSTDIRLFVEVDANAAGFELLTDIDLGTLGNSDVVISSYLFDSIKEAGLYNNLTSSGEGYVTLNDYNDIVGKKLALSSPSGGITAVTVRGVFRQDPPEKYSSLKDANSAGDTSLLSTFQQEVQMGMYSMVLVSDQFYGNHNMLSVSYGITPWTQLMNQIEVRMFDSANKDDFIGSNYVYGISPFDGSSFAPENVYFFGEEKTSLAENEVIVSVRLVSSFLYSVQAANTDRLREETYKAESEKILAPYREEHKTELDDYYKQQYDSYLNYYGYGEEEAAQQAELDRENYLMNIVLEDVPDFYQTIDNVVNKTVNDFSNQFSTVITILESGQYYKDNVNYAATAEDFENALNFLSQYISGDIAANWSYKLYDTSGFEAGTGSLNVVGFFYNEPGFSSSEVMLLNKNVYDSLVSIFGASNNGNDPNGEFYYAEESKYVSGKNDYYNYFVIPFPEDSVLTALVNNEKIYAADDSAFALSSPLSEQMRFANELIASLKTVFLWVGVAMALFSMLLLFNFISVSIANKKKEIGILRAVGARSTDVFKIFYSESAIIAVICYALAMIACFVICPILNTKIAAALGASIFVFGPMSWLIMLAIAIFTSVVATFLPVYSIARKKPVESIRAL